MYRSANSRRQHFHMTPALPCQWLLLQEGKEGTCNQRIYVHNIHIKHDTTCVCLCVWLCACRSTGAVRGSSRGWRGCAAYVTTPRPSTACPNSTSMCMQEHGCGERQLKRLGGMCGIRHDAAPLDRQFLFNVYTHPSASYKGVSLRQRLYLPSSVSYKGVSVR